MIEFKISQNKIKNSFFNQHISHSIHSEFSPEDHHSYEFYLQLWLMSLWLLSLQAKEGLESAMIIEPFRMWVEIMGLALKPTIILSLYFPNFEDSVNSSMA